METTATSKEKEYSNQIYSLLLYLSIFLIVYNAYFHFEPYFMAAYSESVLLQFFNHFNRQLGVPRNFFLTETSSFILVFLAMATAMVSKPKLVPNANTFKANTMLLLGAAMILGAAFFSLTQWGTLGFVALVTIQALGLMAVINGGLIFASLVVVPDADIFNETNEQFPQFEILLDNEYSVNYKTQYRFGGGWRQGYVNVVNPHRAVMVMGGQGAGKTYSLLNPAIWQSIYKGNASMVYDAKYPSLTLEAFNALAKSLENDKHAFGKLDDGQPVIPQFAVINFDDPAISVRCNPLGPAYVKLIDDAAETANQLLLNLNRTWIKKQGDFFSDSAINYLTMVIWFLRIVERKHADRLNGRSVCTLPHCIEMIAQNHTAVIGIIATYPELHAYSSVFKTALDSKAADQLAGQVASVQNALAPLASPNIYWTMTGDDITLDINNPKRPKVLCLANNPERPKVYSAALSVYTSTIMRLIYQYKTSGMKSAFFVDELPTMYLKGLDNFIATVRSYKVATWLGIQDMEQLTKDYGRDEANVILNTCGTVFSGAVNAQSAETLSKMFGKNQQANVSTSYQKSDMSISESNRMEQLVPASKISTLSQGNFVGKVADDFGQPIDKKLFNAYFCVETGEMKKTLPLPTGVPVDQEEIVKNFNRIKEDVAELLLWEQQANTTV